MTKSIRNIATLLLLSLITFPFTSSTSAEETWQQLFNGKNLDGWTPKIRGYELGDNFGDTFKVEDGVMKVGYEAYDEYKERFGHIFYKTSYSHYRMRLEYRFVGDQSKGGPGWAYRNSGIMIHCQSPESMTKDQKFPVSIEVQLLGGNADGDRTTSNLCTPGTNVVMKDALQQRHCISSSSATYRGDRWVTAEIEVRGGGIIKHILDGKVVLQYSKPQLDPRDADAKRLIAERKTDSLILEGGYISLQSESHPIEFRKVEILKLDK